MKSQSLSLLFGGILPIIAFTLIEENYGPLWGTAAGMVFGIGEIIFELYRYRKVSTITWIGNGMILGLGGISIFTQDGSWHKMQPAIFELFFALFLWGSLLAKKNFLLLMAEKQNQSIPDFIKPKFNDMTFRIGVFFFLHSLLATWAALYWSTAAWAWLKGAGVLVSFVFYMLIEAIYLRSQIRNQIKKEQE